MTFKLTKKQLQKIHKVFTECWVCDHCYIDLGITVSSCREEGDKIHYEGKCDYCGENVSGVVDRDDGTDDVDEN